MPIAGRKQAIDWSRNAWKALRYTLIRGELAGSGDLGIALGRYDGITGSGKEHGTWVRVWKRDSSQRWRIVFETSKK
jgi:hypothetical protein